jgi:serine/threonine protein kinase/Tfp pilus assembly protein PilF
MNLSVGRRTWEEASSPTAVRLAQRYEQAWRDSGERPILDDFLADSVSDSDGPGTRLAVLRADMSLRWEAGEKLGAQWYLDHYPDLGQDTIVALIYEEYCLREDDQESPDPAQYLARYPQFAEPLGRVLEIHELVGSGSAASLSLSPEAGGTRSGDRGFPETGQTIAGFSLVEELGRGAFGRVFLARERQLADRPVALKVTRRGSREPQTLARLQHTHIVPVHSHRIDSATGLHLLCMPYFGRITLACVLADPEVQIADSGTALVDALDRLDRLEALPDGLSAGRAALLKRSYPRAIAWWGARLAEALDHAHDRGVLHRDIKPSNVLVTSDGMPMLLDFNLAREPVLEDGTAAAPSTLGGTIDYMAPEHLQALAEGCSDRVDGRADIYGLGTVLYETLIGRRPFDSPRKGASVMEALLRAADERRRVALPLRQLRPDIPPPLEAVIRHCLEPAAANRYQRAAELAVDLQAVADDQPLVYAREPWASRAAGWVRRRRLRLAMASAVFFAICAVLTAALFLAVERHEDEDMVRREYQSGLNAFDLREFEKAKLHFDAIEQLGARLELNLWQRLTRKESFASFGAKLRKWMNQGDRIDLEETKRQARFKGFHAAGTLEARHNADLVFQAADGLRFRLLLAKGDDLTQAATDLGNVLKPFYVFAPGNWAEVDQRMAHPLTYLDPDQQRAVKTEVNELLFLWTTAIEETLVRARENGDGSQELVAREALDKALGICEKALVFAKPREPWLALKARLKSGLSSPHDEPAARDASQSARLPGEPRNVEDEDSALACFQWGLLCFRKLSLGRANDWLQRAVRLKPGDYWYESFLAIVKDERGFLDEALLHYSEAVSAKPDSPWILFNRARLYRSKGWWEWAITDMDDALSAFNARVRSGQGLTPRSEIGQVRLELGYLYQELGDFAHARREYEQVVALDPKSHVGRAARLNEANMEAESGAVDRAFQIYDELLAMDPQDSAAQHSRALLSLKRGQTGQALIDLNSLLDRRPKLKNRDELLAARAIAHLVLGHKAEAVVDATEARHLRPSPAHARLMHRALLAAGRIDALQLDRPEEISLLPVGGQRLIADLKTVAGALAGLARTDKDEAFRTSLVRAVILAALGEHRGALAAASAAIDISPFSANAYLIRARVHWFCGDEKNAWADVKRGLSIQPAYPGLLELRGVLRAHNGDEEGALDDFNEAIAQGTSDRIHLYKATTLARSHAEPKLEKAVEEWSLALRGDPELPEAYLGRAQTQIRLHRWDRALADLEQAASWAHSAPGVELKIVWAYLQCLRDRPDRFSRWFVLAQRTARDVWGVLAERTPSALAQAH